MAITATAEHTTVVTGADEPGKEVNKDQWNGTGAHSVAVVVEDNTLVAAKLAASATDVLFGRSTAAAGAGEEVACTAAGRAILDDANAAAQRATLAAFGTITQRVYTSSDTWSKPANLIAVWVRVQAPGGGGGGADGGAGTGASAGGSGGGGGYSEKYILAAALGGTETVTIGAVGAAGTASGGGNGGQGGTTSFGTHASCTGGLGGTGDAAPTTVTTVTPGGDGGVGSSGNVNINGQAGGWGFANGLAGHDFSTSGVGGSAVLGGGALAVTASGTFTTAGNNAGNYGGGGSGSALNDSSTDQAGGTGGPGIIIVWEITP